MYGTHAVLSNPHQAATVARCKPCSGLEVRVDKERVSRAALGDGSILKRARVDEALGAPGKKPGLATEDTDHLQHSHMTRFQCIACSGVIQGTNCLGGGSTWEDVERPRAAQQVCTTGGTERSSVCGERRGCRRTGSELPVAINHAARPLPLPLSLPEQGRRTPLRPESVPRYV